MILFYAGMKFLIFQFLLPLKNVFRVFLLSIDFVGLIDYVTTEISTSKQKKFSLVTFIDTPGLVDGEMNYPFDVEKAIKFLGKVSDQ